MKTLSLPLSLALSVYLFRTGTVLFALARNGNAEKSLQKSFPIVLGHQARRWNGVCWRMSWIGFPKCVTGVQFGHEIFAQHFYSCSHSSHVDLD